MKTHQARLETPFAVLGVATEGGLLTGIEFLPPDTLPMPAVDGLTREVCAQLRAYLADPAFCFDIPLGLRGTPFQLKVWQALQRIPCGRSESYGTLARRLDSSPRAVGRACGANPIALVVPCHRVVAQHGLGGFMNHGEGDALAIKRWLLRHEHGQSSAA